jgi:hypothetical protein
MDEKNGAWIGTVPVNEASDKLRAALEGQGGLYPPEYRVPVPSLETYEQKSGGAGIVMSHSLLPDTLYHAFATYGTLLSPDLPLSRRQHEMIAATVSSLNRCFY